MINWPEMLRRYCGTIVARIHVRGNLPRPSVELAGLGSARGDKRSGWRQPRSVADVAFDQALRAVNW
jgi:hypothetical protein